MLLLGGFLASLELASLVVGGPVAAVAADLVRQVSIDPALYRLITLTDQHRQIKCVRSCY